MQALLSDDPNERAVAVHTLRLALPNKSVDLLFHVATTDPDQSVRQAAITALEELEVLADRLALAPAGIAFSARDKDRAIELIQLAADRPDLIETEGFQRSLGKFLKIFAAAGLDSDVDPLSRVVERVPEIPVQIAYTLAQHYAIRAIGSEEVESDLIEKTETYANLLRMNGYPDLAYAIRVGVYLRLGQYENADSWLERVGYLTRTDACNFAETIKSYSITENLAVQPKPEIVRFSETYKALLGRYSQQIAEFNTCKSETSE